MVKVAKTATNKIIAWRVRDAMARHPSLNSATACIVVHTGPSAAGPNSVQLEGWTLDDRVRQLAISLAVRAAGCHPVQSRLHTERARLMESILPKSANEKHILLLSCGNEAPTAN